MPDTSTELFQNSVASSLINLNDKPTDIISEIQFKGTYRGRKAYFWNILANRTAFADTTSLHDVCEFLTTGISFTPVTSTDVLEIVSSSVNDSATGSGARKVRVVYLNENGILTESPDISLNGIMPVAAGFNASGILWMEVTDGGSADVSAGNISLQRTLVGTVFERITAGGNKSLSGRMIVPKGFTAYLQSWSVSAVQQNFDARIRATTTTLNRVLNPKFLFQSRIALMQGAILEKNLNLLKYPELSRIKISVIPSSTSNPRVDVSFDVILIANS